DDAAIEVPDEDWCVRKLDQPGRMAQMLVALRESLFHLVSLGDIDKADDEPINLVVNRAVGAKPHLMPAALAGTNLPFNGRQMGENGLRIVGKILVLKLVGKVGNRPAFVTLFDIEEVCDRWRKPLYAQRRIEKQNADIGRRHQILQVTVGA